MENGGEYGPTRRLKRQRLPSPYARPEISSKSQEKQPVSAIRRTFASLASPIVSLAQKLPGVGAGLSPGDLDGEPEESPVQPVLSPAPSEQTSGASVGAEAFATTATQAGVTTPAFLTPAKPTGNPRDTLKNLAGLVADSPLVARAQSAGPHRREDSPVAVPFSLGQSPNQQSVSKPFGETAAPSSMALVSQAAQLPVRPWSGGAPIRGGASGSQTGPSPSTFTTTGGFSGGPFRPQPFGKKPLFAIGTGSRFQGRGKYEEAKPSRFALPAKKPDPVRFGRIPQKAAAAEGPNGLAFLDRTPGFGFNPTDAVAGPFHRPTPTSTRPTPAVGRASATQGIKAPGPAIQALACSSRTSSLGTPIPLRAEPQNVGRESREGQQTAPGKAATTPTPAGFQDQASGQKRSRENNGGTPLVVQRPTRGTGQPRPWGSADRRSWRAGSTPFNPAKRLRSGPSNSPEPSKGPDIPEPRPMTEVARTIMQVLDGMTKTSNIVTERKPPVELPLPPPPSLSLIDVTPKPPQKVPPFMPPTVQFDWSRLSAPDPEPEVVPDQRKDPGQSANINPGHEVIPEATEKATSTAQGPPSFSGFAQKAAKEATPVPSFFEPGIPESAKPPAFLFSSSTPTPPTTSAPTPPAEQSQPAWGNGGLSHGKTQIQDLKPAPSKPQFSFGGDRPKEEGELWAGVACSVPPERRVHVPEFQFGGKQQALEEVANRKVASQPVAASGFTFGVANDAEAGPPKDEAKRVNAEAEQAARYGLPSDHDSDNDNDEPAIEANGEDAKAAPVSPSGWDADFLLKNKAASENCTAAAAKIIDEAVGKSPQGSVPAGFSFGVPAKLADVEASKPAFNFGVPIGKENGDMAGKPAGDDKFNQQPTTPFPPEAQKPAEKFFSFLGQKQPEVEHPAVQKPIDAGKAEDNGPVGGSDAKPLFSSAAKPTETSAKPFSFAAAPAVQEEPVHAPPPIKALREPSNESDMAMSVSPPGPSKLTEFVDGSTAQSAPQSIPSWQPSWANNGGASQSSGSMFTFGGNLLTGPPAGPSIGSSAPGFSFGVQPAGGGTGVQFGSQATAAASTSSALGFSFPATGINAATQASGGFGVSSSALAGFGTASNPAPAAFGAASTSAPSFGSFPSQGGGPFGGSTTPAFGLQQQGFPQPGGPAGVGLFGQTGAASGGPFGGMNFGQSQGGISPAFQGGQQIENSFGNSGGMTLGMGGSGGAVAHRKKVKAKRPTKK